MLSMPSLTDVGLSTHYRGTAYNEMLHRTSDLDGFYGTTYAMESGHGIWHVQCKDCVYRAG
jgi:hypothetical protein